MTAGPISPGLGPKSYQPVMSGELGTCREPSDSRPVLTTGATSAIDGIRRVTGSAEVTASGVLWKAVSGSAGAGVFGAEGWVVGCSVTGACAAAVVKRFERAVVVL